LRPQFTNSVELSPTFGGFPVATFGYSHTRDVFTQILDTRGEDATYMTQENIADQRNYTVTVNAPTKIGKWWDGFVSLTGYRSAFSAQFREGFAVDQTFYAYTLYSEQTIRLPHSFSIQLSGWFNSDAYWGTLSSKAQGAMDLGIAKKIWNDQGEVKLRFGDILHTAGWKGENVFTPGLKMNARGNWESRIVALNFSYRFGSSEVKGARQRKTGLEEEGKRVKSGRN
jgi:iron complex outermembrane receptor protein